MRRWISRHGLSRCPACGQHVHTDPTWQATVCPFCDSAITARPAARRYPGRGGLIAAALFGASLAGCGGAPPDPTFTPPPPAQPDPANPPASPEPAPEPPAMPEYGIAPAPEPIEMPEYGMAPTPDD